MDPGIRTANDHDAGRLAAGQGLDFGRPVTGAEPPVAFDQKFRWFHSSPLQAHVIALNFKPEYKKGLGRRQAQ